MDKLEPLLKELCDTLYYTCMERLKDGHITDSPLDQIQDALSVMIQEYKEFKEDFDKTTEDIEVADMSNVLFLVKNEEVDSDEE